MSDAGDDDLLDDFLAAAGIGGSASRDASPDSSPSAVAKPTPKKRKNPPKSSALTKGKRRKRSPDSESEAEISEDELEDIAITPPPRSRRGMKNEASAEDDDTFENPYPFEGKYKNEEDRQRLLSMTEIEREDVLYQRSEEVQRLKEKRDLAALVRSQIKDQPRRSGREGQLRSEKAGKRDELSELKKRREEKSNAAKVKTPTKPKSAVGEEAEESSEESGELSGREGEKADESNVQVTCQIGIVIIPNLSRSLLDAIPRIDGLVTVSKYSVESVPVDQGLELSQGSTKRVINMDFASNASIEFDRYIRKVKESGGFMASKKYLAKKTQDVQEMQNYKLADADITAMIEKKKSLSRIPKNVVHEKTRLKQLHLAAISSGNESEAEKIQEQLTFLEELAQGNRDKSISRENEMFLKVNERNRKMNMVEMREAERRGAEERRRNALSTDMAVMDPFSRRKTIPKTFYENLASSRGGSPAPSSGVNTPKLAPTTDAAPENLIFGTPGNSGQTVNSKRVKVDDVIAQIDFGIDIEI